jgi:hypothetical protein
MSNLMLKLVPKIKLHHLPTQTSLHLMPVQNLLNPQSLKRPPNPLVLWWPCAAMTALVKRSQFLHPQVVAQAIAAMAKEHLVLTVVIEVIVVIDQIDPNAPTAVRV